MASAPFWRQNLPYIMIALLDVFGIGLASGLPILAVFYGFGVGWWFVRRGPYVLPESLPETVGPRWSVHVSVRFSRMPLRSRW